MDDAQKAPAPPAETERAVEVAAGLTPSMRRVLRGEKPNGRSQHGGWTAVYAALIKRGVLDERLAITPLGLAVTRLVARSLKGEG